VRNTIAGLLLAGALCISVAAPVLATSDDVPAPSLTASGPGCSVEHPDWWCLDYSCVSGPSGPAVKYAFQAVVVYCNPPVSTDAITKRFEFTASDCDDAYPGGGTVTLFDPSRFAICDPLDPTCLLAGPMTPGSISFRVKGLEVAPGSEGPQNHPFSDWSPAAPDASGCTPNVCATHGDIDGSGTIDVGDVFYLNNHLFAGGPAPVCSGDVDGSGTVNVNDVFYLVNYLFAGGPPPV